MAGSGLGGVGAAATGFGEASGSFGATGVGGAAFSGEAGFGADGRRRGGSGSRSGFAASLSVSRACSCERLWFGVSVAGAAGVGRAAGVVCGPAGVGLGGVCGFSGFGGDATSHAGTTEEEPCSNRGLCDKVTGQCTCFHGYGMSNGLGGRGTIADCGYKLEVV